MVQSRLWEEMVAISALKIYTSRYNNGHRSSKGRPKVSSRISLERPAYLAVVLRVICLITVRDYRKAEHRCTRTVHHHSLRFPSRDIFQGTTRAQWSCYSVVAVI